MDQRNGTRSNCEHTGGLFMVYISRWRPEAPVALQQKMPRQAYITN